MTRDHSSSPFSPPTRPLRLCRFALVIAVVACQPPAAVVDNSCVLDEDCATGEVCLDLVCVEEEAQIPCNGDEFCPAGHICGEAGFCEEGQRDSTACRATSDCPIAQYCNLSIEGGLCMPLQEGACRESTQCTGGLVCSAMPGGVGRCVECLEHADCASGQCLPDGTCAVLGRDAGPGLDAGPGVDRILGRDQGGSGDDPSCGGASQRCCGGGSYQPTECDTADMRCLRNVPNAGDAYCWRPCTPVPCTTIQNTTGWCHLGADTNSQPIGNCQSGSDSLTCTSTTECLYNYEEGECVWVSDYSVVCLRLGCDMRANCEIGRFCSTVDGNLCLDVSLWF